MDLFSFNYLDPEKPVVPTPEPEPVPEAKAKRVVKPEERIVSVGQLMRETREALERGFSRVWVKGEISNFKPHPSGHQYFTLKDAQAQISCVLWRSQAMAMTLKLRDGMEVQVCGDVTVYETRGQLQMTVRKVQQSGLGELQLRFEELKRKLSQEGLFHADRKKRLPTFPQTVAIVTASSGAALRDMLQVLGRRAPWVRVLVYSVPVQGAGAHVQIAKAIRWLNEQQPGLPKIDVLVVARGGGSLEDLWSFNEESVARALADSTLPTISAVGHEIDFTIADFVADLRAPTPSAAAELLAPDRVELSMSLSRWGQSMQYRVRQILQHHGRVLALMESGNLRRVVERTLANKQQALDEMDTSLQQSVAQIFQRQQSRLQELRFRLEQHSPAAELQRRRATLALLGEKLQSRTNHRVSKLKSSIDHLRQLLQSLSPDATMARGYTLTMDPAGRPLRSAKQLKPGDEIRTRLSDGEVRSVVKS